MTEQTQAIPDTVPTRMEQLPEFMRLTLDTVDELPEDVTPERRFITILAVWWEHKYAVVHRHRLIIRCVSLMTIAFCLGWISRAYLTVSTETFANDTPLVPILLVVSIAALIPLMPFRRFSLTP
jgi:hypothetical protein